MPSYFCHQCNRERSSSEIFNDNDSQTSMCSTCGSDFVEEISDSNRQDLLLSNPTGSGLRQLLQHLQDPEFNRHQPQLTVPVLNFGLHRMMDFLDSGALDQVVTHLLGHIDPSGGAPPPATPEQLAVIKTVCITEEQVKEGLQCFVCLDEFKQGVSAEVLPCEHHFHKQCIRPWLEKRGTCPVCRSSLSQAAPGTDGAAPDDASVDEPAELGAVGGLWGGASAAFSAASSSNESRQTGGRRRRRSRDYVEDECD